MPLILAIEPDRNQASHLDALARNHLHTELLVVDSAIRALDTLAERVPDVILTSALLSPREDAALSDRLRDLGAAASHIQTLTIPIFSVAQPAVRKKGVLAGLLKKRQTRSRDHGGCEPAAFAEQIALYLERAALERGLGVTGAPVKESDAEGSALAEVSSDIRLTELSTDLAMAVALEAIVDDQALDAMAEKLDEPLIARAASEGLAASDQGVAESLDAKTPALAIEAQSQPEIPAEVLAQPTDSVSHRAEAVSDQNADDVAFFNLELEWLEDDRANLTTGNDDIAAQLQTAAAPIVAGEEMPFEEQLLESSIEAEFASDFEEDEEEHQTARLEHSEAEDFDPPARSVPEQTMGKDVPLDTAVADSSMLTMELEWLAEESTNTGAGLKAQEPALMTRDSGLMARDPKPPAQGSRCADQEPGPRIAAGCKADDLEVDLTMLSRFIDESRLGQDPAYEMEVAADPASGSSSKQEDKSPAAAEAARVVVALPPSEPPQATAPTSDALPTSKLRSLLDFEKHVAERISRKRAEKTTDDAKSLAPNAKKPPQDEWGLFDPDQCGFSALIEKLEEISAEDSSQPHRADERFRVS
jgi:hypothetical protein